MYVMQDQISKGYIPVGRAIELTPDLQKARTFNGTGPARNAADYFAGKFRFGYHATLAGFDFEPVAVELTVIVSQNDEAEQSPST